MDAVHAVNSARVACLAAHQQANESEDQPVPSSACRDLSCKTAAFNVPDILLSSGNGCNACGMFLPPHPILQVPTAGAFNLALMSLGCTAGVSTAATIDCTGSTCPRLPQPCIVAPPHHSAWFLFRAPRSRWRLGRLVGLAAQRRQCRRTPLSFQTVSSACWRLDLKPLACRAPSWRWPLLRLATCVPRWGIRPSAPA